jgi:hypothetical protein
LNKPGDTAISSDGSAQWCEHPPHLPGPAQLKVDTQEALEALQNVVKSSHASEAWVRTLELVSPPGKGTRVSATLPAESRAEAAQAATA